MKFKLLIGSILLASASLSHAGNVYLAPTVFLERISGNHTTYANANPVIALGYSAMPRNVYLAGEVFVRPFSADISNNHNLNTYSAKIANSIGVSFIPGGMITDSVLLFGRLGVVVSKFKSPNVYTTGGEFGLGLQSKLIDNWSMRTEYDFTAYRTVAGMGSPKSNQIGIGLIYSFDHPAQNTVYKN